MIYRGKADRLLARPLRWLALTLSLSAVAGFVHASDITDRMSLIEAIKVVRDEGIDIAYSSQLVKPWMRVRTTPVKHDPLDALREVLAELSLELQPFAGERWLVVRGADKAHQDFPQPDNSASAEAPGPIVQPPLEEIIIVSSQYSLFSRDGASQQFLTGEEIRLMPHIADDAFRAFHRLPGVAANDFQAPFNLRGGAVDEVKVVLDGLELIEPYHMRTLFSPLSVIDPGIIAHAQLLSGGFTVNYGNHMSGVIDVSSKQPGTESTHQLGVSFVNAFARSRGTFASGRGDYQLSLRRGYLDLIGDSITDEDEDLNPRFSDVFASSRYSINDTVDVTAHVLSAYDDVEFTNTADGEDLGD
ncbi:MAG: TonB-dependent receptor plug domain-containing protein [Pseudomonadota bacterium]